jgi:methylenetetrahydrofolate reductase (NADPH)
MNNQKRLADRIKAGDFIITAEFLPQACSQRATVEEVASRFKNKLAAVNVSDNPHGPVLSSLAGSVILNQLGMEPVYQMVTRDRNRIAIQSDLLGAAALGIENVLCLSGHHQTLTGSHESANVYDIDSIQLISLVKKMRDEGVLLDGAKIKGGFSMLVGAAASPDMKPMALNIMRLVKKVKAGADFIQTQAVFDTNAFEKWLEKAKKQEITSQTAILAGVLPLAGAAEAERLKNKYTDIYIPESIIDRLKEAGDEASQEKEGLAICIETIKTIREMAGLSGIHILSGGKERMIPDIIAGAEL